MYFYQKTNTCGASVLWHYNYRNHHHIRFTAFYYNYRNKNVILVLYNKYTAWLYNNWYSNCIITFIYKCVGSTQSHLSAWQRKEQYTTCRKDSWTKIHTTGEIRLQTYQAQITCPVFLTAICWLAVHEVLRPAVWLHGSMRGWQHSSWHTGHSQASRSFLTNSQTRL